MMPDFYGTIAYKMMLAANMRAGYRSFWSSVGLAWGRIEQKSDGYVLVPVARGLDGKWR